MPKARLFACGFAKMNTQERPKDSPIRASESLQLIMAVICPKKWQLSSMDVIAAFFNEENS